MLTLKGGQHRDRKKNSRYREPLPTRDSTLMENLREEVHADIMLMRIRYTHKVIFSDHVIVIRSRNSPSKPNFFNRLISSGREIGVSLQSYTHRFG